MTDLKIANMLADYHKECEAAETLREKADVQLKHAQLIQEALLKPMLSDSFPLSEERVEELALMLANHDFDSNIGKVIIPLKVCKQIVIMITENLR